VTDALRHWTRPGTLQLQELPPLSLYIHLPWCLKKCPYCDFNSHEWGATAAPGAAMPELDYVAAVVADLESALPLIWGRTVQTVFIGGGTPSLFSPDAIDRLLPPDDVYRHRHGSRGHGRDHILPTLVPPSLTLPVHAGTPALGTWQSVVVVDTNVDNPVRTLHLSFISG